MGGMDSCLVNFAVVKSLREISRKPLDFTDTPRNVVVCRALPVRWSLGTGATHDAGETHLPHSACDERQIDLRS